jgi:hypothetical protein
MKAGMNGANQEDFIETMLFKLRSERWVRPEMCGILVMICKMGISECLKALVVHRIFDGSTVAEWRQSTAVQHQYGGIS